jgi:hypothetical protein
MYLPLSILRKGQGNKTVLVSQTRHVPPPPVSGLIFQAPLDSIGHSNISYVVEDDFRQHLGMDT